MCWMKILFQLVFYEYMIGWGWSLNSNTMACSQVKVKMKTKVLVTVHSQVADDFFYFPRGWRLSKCRRRSPKYTITKAQ